MRRLFRLRQAKCTTGKSSLPPQDRAADLCELCCSILHFFEDPFGNRHFEKAVEKPMQMDKLQQPLCPFCEVVRFCILPGLAIDELVPLDCGYTVGLKEGFREVEIGYFDHDQTKHVYGCVRIARSMANLHHHWPNLHRLCRDKTEDTLDFAKLQTVINRCTLSECSQTSARGSRYSERYKITLIDVEQLCLNTSDTSAKYLALSYVWGSVNGLQAVRANRAQLSTPGALEDLRSEIPQLILDAIELTRRLEQRYLWVDQLCIEQDNVTEKSTQIAHMDVVYRCALTTIVALSSTKASDPLLGVRPGTLLPLYSQVVNINSSYFQSRIDVMEPALFRQSVYETRGWTFQERLLAPRCLYMTGYSAQYHCENKHNDDLWPDFDTPSAEVPGLLFHANFRHGLRRGSIRGEEDVFDAYKRFVQDFKKRELRYQSDGINAFAGVYSWLETYGLGQSICGLPENFLCKALLWSPPARQKCRRNNVFPSWSWAGWDGLVEFEAVSHRHLEQMMMLDAVEKHKSQHCFCIGEKTRSSWDVPFPLLSVCILRVSADCVSFDGFTVSESSNFMRFHRPGQEESFGTLFMSMSDFKDIQAAAILETQSMVRMDLVGLFREPIHYNCRKPWLIIMLIGYQEQRAQRIAIGKIEQTTWNSFGAIRKSMELI